jgi:hypothetical protein
VSGSKPTPTASIPAQQSAPTQSNPDLERELEELEAEAEVTARRTTRTRQQWGWIGAGLIFMSSLLCGGFFAAYVGWQMVSSELLAPSPGVVESIAAAPSPAPPQVYFVVTATSEPVIVPSGIAESLPSDPNRFPVAVTPTPDHSLPLAPQVSATGAQVPGGQLSVLPQQPALPVETMQPILPMAEPPPFDMQMEIPTRRPTPVLDIPTSTPSAADLEPPPTQAPTFAGPPLVLFSAKDSTLISGECTTVSWNVENVRAVYYENLGVDGQGEKRECVRDRPGLYTLAVVFASGDTRIYTTTVDVVFPTPSPMPTATFTDIPPPTPTWTPEAPTATPTPNVQYGVKLDASASTLTCVPGQPCVVELYLTNTGSAIDNLSIQFVEAGPWQARVCRLDGVCSDNLLTLVSMGPGNTGVVRLQVTVPDSSPHSESGYRLQAFSDGSGKSAQSSVVSLRAVKQ